MSNRAQRLSAVIRYFDAALRARGVVWGSVDCFHFALAGAHAAGRADLRPLLPRYNSELGAIRALRRSGYPTIVEALDAHATPITSTQALPGDIAYDDAPPIGALGLVVGADALFFAPDGLRKKPIAGRWLWRA